MVIEFSESGMARYKHIDAQQEVPSGERYSRTRTSQQHDLSPPKILPSVCP